MTFPAAWFAAYRVLRIAFAIRCIGLGSKYLWRAFEADSNIFGTLLFDWGYSESLAQRVDDGGMWLMVVSGAGMFVLGMLLRTQSPSLAPSPTKTPQGKRFSLSKRCAEFWREKVGGRGPDRITLKHQRLVTSCALPLCLLLLFAFVWELLLAASAMYRGGEFLSEWTLAESGLRIANPLVLLLMTWRLSRSRSNVEPNAGSLWVWILRIATALTFAVHGWKAWLAAPTFVTMIIASGDNLFGYWPEQSLVEPILKVICVADILVAIFVLAVRWPRVAAYAAVWGLITAVARMTSSTMGWPETLLRAAHVGGPLALYLQWRSVTAVKET